MALNVAFDPLKDLLTAQDDKPSHLRTVNLRTLTPFERALLVIDGTVTKFIEAYMMEPIEIVHLGQKKEVLDEGIKWLAVEKGTQVLIREVLLRGTYSNLNYSYAVSLIALERLAEPVRNKILLGAEGLGTILYSERIETYREVLWYGKEQFQDAIQQAMGRDCLSRTYRVIVDNRPIMLINEKFPCLEDISPFHH